MKRALCILVCVLLGCGGTSQQTQSAADWEPAKKRDIRVSLIKTLIDAKAYATSVPLLRKALVESPKDARLHYMLGTVLRERRLYGKAMLSFEKAIALAPKFGAAYSGQAMTMNMQGHHDAALALHQKAVTLSPRDPRLLNNLGFGFSLLSRHEEAVKAYQDALALNPNQRNTYVNLGFSHAFLGNEIAAKSAFSQVLKPGETLNNLALVKEMNGKPEAAIKLYAEALSVHPDLEVAQENLNAAQDELSQDKEEQ